MIDLTDASEKLRWAKHHFDILKREIEPFEQRDTHTFRVEADPKEGTYTFYVSGLEQPDPDWGLRIGDCLHNARSALDYIMVCLWAAVTSQHPRDVEWVQFPIYDDPKKFAGAVGERRKNLAFSGYLARIEELQPFNAGNPSVWGAANLTPSLPHALQRLQLLDNIDKHRVIHAAWLGIRWGGWFAPEKDAPASFTPIGGSISTDPLEGDTKVAEYRFGGPLPEEWVPSQVQMKRYLPLQVSIDEPSPLKRVLEILPWCISGAEAVLEIFRPVFEHGAPPLPVTAVRTIRG